MATVKMFFLLRLKCWLWFKMNFQACTRCIQNSGVRKLWTDLCLPRVCINRWAFVKGTLIWIKGNYTFELCYNLLCLIAVIAKVHTNSTILEQYLLQCHVFLLMGKALCIQVKVAPRFCWNSTPRLLREPFCASASRWVVCLVLLMVASFGDEPLKHDLNNFEWNCVI